MMHALFEEQGSSLRISILGEKPTQEFIDEHASILDSSMEMADLTPTMRNRLSDSNYIFSGIKTFHELNEAFPSLLDENGNRKPFNQFLNDVQAIDSEYNDNYLRTEYNFVGASADMAARWESFSNDPDRYLLQYRTAGDDLVRPEHAALEGITLPQDDPFWDEYYPPNGWNCRCTVVEVLRNLYDETPHLDAIDHARMATSKDVSKMFHFNPGKQSRAVPAYNAYTIQHCNNCQLGVGNGEPLNNELCKACQFIQKKIPGVITPGTFCYEKLLL